MHFLFKKGQDKINLMDYSYGVSKSRLSQCVLESFFIKRPQSLKIQKFENKIWTKSFFL